MRCTYEIQWKVMWFDLQTGTMPLCILIMKFIWWFNAIRNIIECNIQANTQNVHSDTVMKFKLPSDHKPRQRLELPKLFRSKSQKVGCPCRWHYNGVMCVQVILLYKRGIVLTLLTDSTTNKLALFTLVIVEKIRDYSCSSHAGDQ